MLIAFSTCSASNSLGFLASTTILLSDNSIANCSGEIELILSVSNPDAFQAGIPP